MEFLPVILGSDDNAYGMARSFHEEYGIKSIVITKGHLLPTAHSKIIEKRMVPGFDDIENFVCRLKSLAARSFIFSRFLMRAWSVDRLKGLVR